MRLGPCLWSTQSTAWFGSSFVVHLLNVFRVRRLGASTRSLPAYERRTSKGRIAAAPAHFPMALRSRLPLPPGAPPKTFSLGLSAVTRPPRRQDQVPQDGRVLHLLRATRSLRLKEWGTVQRRPPPGSLSMERFSSQGASAQVRSHEASVPLPGPSLNQTPPSSFQTSHGVVCGTLTPALCPPTTLIVAPSRHRPLFPPPLQTQLRCCRVRQSERMTD